MLAVPVNVMVRCRRGTHVRLIEIMPGYTTHPDVVPSSLRARNDQDLTLYCTWNSRRQSWSTAVNCPMKRDICPFDRRNGHKTQPMVPVSEDFEQRSTTIEAVDLLKHNVGCCIHRCDVSPEKGDARLIEKTMANIRLISFVAFFLVEPTEAGNKNEIQSNRNHTRNPNPHMWRWRPLLTPFSTLELLVIVKSAGSASPAS